MDRNDDLAFSAVLELIVALRKESVDRNIRTLILRMAHLMSLSARRAWIEIHAILGGFQNVACRSPQGERG